MPIQTKSLKRRIRTASERQEKKVAKQLGGRRQPGSGCGPWNKSDVVVQGTYRIEAKLTSKKQYALKRADLHKLRMQCEVGVNGLLEVPVMHVQFTNERFEPEEQYVVMPYAYWLRLILKEGK